MKLRLAILLVLIGAGFLGILSVQVKWQLQGTRDPRLVKFLRRYDRGDAMRKLPTRGDIVDRHGVVLAHTPEGSVWNREYPLGAAAVHPVGCYDRAGGITGCERSLDALLSTATTNGTTSSFRLTLDSRLQAKAYELMNGKRGAVVVMSPVTGRIRALVSTPGFDPSDPVCAMSAEGAPLFNRALQGLYPPGSTFKLFTAASSLDGGLDPRFDCPAAGFVPAAKTPPIRDSEALAAKRGGWKWKGFGRIGMEEALVHSSNTYFAQLGIGCGLDGYASHVMASRLRDSVPLLPGDEALESSPCSLPDVAKRPLLASIAIGQGELLMTPLAVAMLTSAIANDGIIVAPSLDESARPKIFSRPFKPASARKVKAFMRQVVERGTGKKCRIAGLPVCGKTGTAQNGGKDDHAWFTCFAPEGSPKLTVTVLVENGGFGADAALPIAREFLLYAQSLGYLDSR